MHSFIFRRPLRRLNSGNGSRRVFYFSGRGGLIATVLISILLGVARLSTAQGAASISGTVQDPSGAVVANATVTIQNPVSTYQRSTITNASGNFRFPNVPFNPYHLTVTASGFAPAAQDVEIGRAHV